MKISLLFLILVLPGYLLAQGTQPPGTAVANLDVSNINPTILTGGDMFHDLQTNNPHFPGMPNQGFEVPRGSGKHTFFSASLWLGSTDPMANLYVAAQTYRAGTPLQVNYWPGPVATVHNAAHSAKYDKIWKVSRPQIQNHISNYNQPGYTIPPDIASWPGNGNLANGEAAKLAPFVDLNNDGIYSPGQGDYPNIKGDQALYLILNDKGNVKVPLSATMNAEIHMMYYGFDNPLSPAIYNTLFCQYKVINRGQNVLNNFYAGIWADFDLGNFNDDYVGCDTLTNRFFCYNGDNDDDGPLGYGLNPPVQSISFLDRRMTNFMYYNNTNHPINGYPTKASDYFNYMHHLWKDGRVVTYGGDGTNQALQPTTHMFPGDPVSGIGWSEMNTLATPAINVPGDRRGVGSTGPYTLLPGAEINFTVGFTYSRGTSNLNSINAAAQDAQTVRNYFRANALATPKQKEQQQTLLLYPNPATGQVNVQLPFSLINKKVTLQVIDYTGRAVLLTNPLQTETTLNLNSLSKGIYQVKVISENQVITGRLIKL